MKIRNPLSTFEIIVIVLWSLMVIMMYNGCSPVAPDTPPQASALHLTIPDGWTADTCWLRIDDSLSAGTSMPGQYTLTEGQHVVSATATVTPDSAGDYPRCPDGYCTASRIYGTPSWAVTRTQEASNGDTLVLFQ